MTGARAERTFTSTSSNRCTPCRGGFAKPELGLESALCIYDKGDTLPLLVGAACVVLLAVGVAAFALRKNEGGLLGSFRRLFSDGFAVAVARTMAEATDVATDGLAVNDVLNNAALASFHTTYGVAFALGSCVSLFVLVKRCFEIRRKPVDPTLEQHTSQQSEAPPRLAATLSPLNDRGDTA